MAEPSSHVAALARERSYYVAQGRPERGIPIDDEMGRLGWCVDTNGKLVEVKDRPAADRVKATHRPVRERAVAPAMPETAAPRD